jgi:hypothetical protein
LGKNTKMPTIFETIRDYDEDILHKIAEGWGIDLELDIKQKNTEQIACRISGDAIINEMIHSLSDNSMRGLIMLASEKGEIPWDQFTREFGELREMGAGRRERERPDRNPCSVTEELYYKALIGKAYFDIGDGLQEFAFIPDEVFQHLNFEEPRAISNSLKPIPTQLVNKTLFTNDHIVDHSCTVLSGLRIGLSVGELEPFTPGIPGSFLVDLLRENKIITDRSKTSSEKIKQFLEADRGPVLRHLALAWKNSHEIDELDLLESLEFESHLKRKPQSSRDLLMKLILKVPDETWFGIQEFCRWIYQSHSDILRSGGEYDAWFIKIKATGETIKGFENWYRVEGEYVRMMILKPLFWLGFVDLGKIQGDTIPTVFKKSKWFNTLMAGLDLKYPSILKKDFELEKSGRIIIERFFPRDIRYQIARCCEWESVRGHKFSFRLTPLAFYRMEQQGLKISQLVALINRYARKPLPQNILLGLERWEKHGQEANIGSVLVLKVKSEIILDQLMASPVNKYILSRQNPTTAEITADSLPFIKAALIDMGVFAEIKPEV